jgi:hypothetical protein
MRDVPEDLSYLFTELERRVTLLRKVFPEILSLPEHGEAADRIPEGAAHEDIRQEMNIERKP